MPITTLRNLLLTFSDFFSLYDSNRYIDDTSLPRFIVRMLCIVILSFAERSMPACTPICAAKPFTPEKYVLICSGTERYVTSSFSSADAYFSFCFSNPVPIRLKSAPVWSGVLALYPGARMSADISTRALSRNMQDV